MSDHGSVENTNGKNSPVNGMSDANSPRKPVEATPEVLRVSLLVSKDDKRDKKIPYNPNNGLMDELERCCSRVGLQLDNFTIIDDQNRPIIISENDKVSILPSKSITLLGRDFPPHKIAKLSNPNIQIGSGSRGPTEPVTRRSKPRTLSAVDNYITKKISLSKLETFTDLEGESLPSLSIEDIFSKIIAEHDKEFGELFFSVYLAFLEGGAANFLSGLIKKYKDTEDSELRSKIISTLEHWMTKYYNDYINDSKAVNEFDQWYNWIKAQDPDKAEFIKSIQTKPSRGNSVNTTHTNSSVFKPLTINESPTKPPLSILEVEPFELARQITIVESKLFHSLKPQDFLFKFNQQKESPNMETILRKSDAISNWIQTELVIETDIKKRTKLFEKFIDVGEYLLKLKNEMGVLEILYALQSAPISRLTKTVGGLTVIKTKAWNNLTKQIVNGTYLKEFNQANFAVPSVAKLLAQLDQIHKSFPTTDDNNLINLQKFQHVYKIIQQIQHFQKVPCLFPVNQDIQNIIESDVLNEDMLMQCSMHIEPAGNTTPEMPERLKEIKQKRKLINKPRARTERRPRNSIHVKTQSELQIHKEQLTAKCGETKVNIDNIFNDLKNFPATAQNAHKLTCEELTKMYDSANSHLTSMAELLQIISPPKEPKNSATSSLLLLTDPTEIPPQVFLPTYVEWFWNSDDGGFTPFDTHTALIIELAYNENKNVPCKLTHGWFGERGGFEINFLKMEQINVLSGYSRKVQRRTNWIREKEHRDTIFDLELKVKNLEEKLVELQKSTSKKSTRDELKKFGQKLIKRDKK